MDLNECGQRNLDDSQANLDRVYTAYLASLSTSPTHNALLEKFQRAWLVFRKGTCEFFEAAQADGGTMGTQIYLERMVKITDRRTQQLSGFESGDPDGTPEDGADESGSEASA